jgi:ATP-dependent DNA helicase RecG
MTTEQLIQELQHLQSLAAETEVVEFKEAKNDFDSTKMGRYFSALCNEANLKNKKCAWLVFGIENANHKIVGTNYRVQSNNRPLQGLKKEIADKTTNRITFIEIYELTTEQGRVILFQIPPAPKGIPVAFEGHYYARDNESLVPLNLSELERIRAQSSIEDWSAKVVAHATIEDLDPNAIQKARVNFKDKNKHLSAEIDIWDDNTFLNKAKLTVKGKITNTCILLLGKTESEHYITPAVAKIRWVLKDSNNIEKDYAIFSCPFLLATEDVYLKIRNLTYRYMKDDSIFPDETPMYDPYNIRESINNCIAHQDYSDGGRINVIEFDDRLIFSNMGSFIPGNIENVLHADAPAEVYRNKFLAEAMYNLKMVDTIGSGIKRMFMNQRNKFFPMPDYLLTDNKVQITIIGKVLDLEYARVLAKNNTLNLNDIILLDKVQKHILLSKQEEKLLRDKKLIEGRKPNYYIGKRVAEKTGQKADYSKNTAFDKQVYIEWILKSLKEHQFLERADIDKLLWGTLPAWMNDTQKKNKITSLISELRKKEVIINRGSDFKSKWEINKL